MLAGADIARLMLRGGLDGLVAAEHPDGAKLPLDMTADDLVVIAANAYSRWIIINILKSICSNNIIAAKTVQYISGQEEGVETNHVSR
jgi:hypothetical protein